MLAIKELYMTTFSPMEKFVDPNVIDKQEFLSYYE